MREINSVTLGIQGYYDTLLQIIIIIIKSIAPIRSVGYLRILSPSVRQPPETLVHSNFSLLL
jgi:hypothetical protein